MNLKKSLPLTMKSTIALNLLALPTLKDAPSSSSPFQHHDFTFGFTVIADTTNHVDNNNTNVRADDDGDDSSSDKNVFNLSAPSDAVRKQWYQYLLNTVQRIKTAQLGNCSMHACMSCVQCVSWDSSCCFCVGVEW